MFSKIKNAFTGNKVKQLTDVRNIGMYIFAAIAVAITWNAVKTVQTNYQLQKQISTLRQQNAVVSLRNQNTALQNQFYQSNEYLDLTARQDLGLAAPGEQILLLPKTVAMKYVDPALSKTVSDSTAVNLATNQSKISKNLEDWRDFLLGRKLSSS